MFKSNNQDNVYVVDGFFYLPPDSKKKKLFRYRVPKYSPLSFYARGPHQPFFFHLANHSHQWICLHHFSTSTARSMSLKKTVCPVDVALNL